MQNNKTKNRSLINRSNLRDVIIVICGLSAIFYKLNGVQLSLSFFLLCFGCFFHYMTKGVLARNVVLYREGAYGLVRHPYYMANYLIDSSFCLLSGNVYLILIYPFLFFWSYGSAIQKEENALASFYGKDFLKYSFDAPQIFPDAYSIRNMRRAIKGIRHQRITRNEISRFMRLWATGLFMVFVHSIKAELVAELNNIIFLRDHYREPILLFIAVILFVASLFVRCKQEPTGQVPELKRSS